MKLKFAYNFIEQIKTYLKALYHLMNKTNIPVLKSHQEEVCYFCMHLRAGGNLVVFAMVHNVKRQSKDEYLN